jgi:hypothetical protein
MHKEDGKKQDSSVSKVTGFRPGQLVFDSWQKFSVYHHLQTALER